MRILLSIHLYFPGHKSGGERYAHNAAKYLQSKGHHVRVWLHTWNGVQEGAMYVYDGIEVFPPDCGHNCMQELFQWADIIGTHLDFSHFSINKARQLKKPVFFMAHNTSDVYNDMINRNWHTYVVYNADHARKELEYKRPAIVLNPAIDPGMISKERNPKYITLINLCRNKGVHIFHEIARRMPDQQFLGIKGSYMKQETSDLPNVTYWEQTEDMALVYSLTKILIVPSDYESWSMCAAEALANGVPVICSKTPGLMENCGDAAIYVERPTEIIDMERQVEHPTPEKTVEGYIKAINRLDKPGSYSYWSKKAIERTEKRVISEQLQEFENLLTRAVYECKHTT